METVFKHDLNNAYLKIEVPDFYVEDYQIPMLHANQIPGILEVDARGIDDFSQYSYKISGMVSMRAMFEKTKMERSDIELFIVQLVQTIKALKRHMLSADKLLLEPDHIFFQKKQFYFCYLPTRNTELCGAFHRLTEYFVSQVNYEEKEGIYLAYELHKSTMEEHYDIEQILEEYQNKKEDTDSRETEERGNIFELEDEEYEDVPTIQELGGTWGNIKRGVRRRKRQKWGVWEGLVMEEKFTNK
ncbi:DUF6382 domain-containing protein [Hespellia stercorisuis]|uniref:DUF6382 domain-containing protein n=1 Tax=Hespellia stercorisuis DSM 15480 TaxID=1121950 RepID=A0A1M6SQ82_9FIRM|nr:DUF6382 domain-containing protein [Hespellia stercorisuis]SHK46797.1 hypothetical protein SAMN02745243_03010 [Hespellia stercorisuis DSM 15480]